MPRRKDRAGKPARYASSRHHDPLPFAAMATGFVYHDRFLKHDTGPGHPERPDRLRAIVDGLRGDGSWDRLTHLDFDPAPASVLERLHSPGYVHRVFETCASGLSYVDTPDSAVCEDSAEIAALAVGGVLRAVEAVVRGEVGNAFCAVRPPGHHAEVGRSMGFCLFGNAALAADAAVRDHGLSRVAVVDFDVHHGNGTQHLLEDRADVLFASLHEDPNHQYPGTGFAHETGRGDGDGFTLNVVLPSGSGDNALLAAFNDAVAPRLDAFKPELLVFSAGFDAAADDPLGHLKVSPAGFNALASSLLDVAQRHAAGRVVSVLEGGYDLDALSAAVSGHVGMLLDAAGGGA
ncbi:MAG: histone deacetylase [Planctomycetota bacterium]